MTFRRASTIAAAAGVLVSLGTLAAAAPVDPAITYQGHLEEGGARADGLYEIVVQVYNAQFGGNLVSSAGSVQAPLVVEVIDGLFAVDLDLDVGQTYNGTERWLEFRVRPQGSQTFTVLSPRQRLAPAPFSNLATRALAADVASDIPAQWKAFEFVPGVGPVYNGSGRVGVGTTSPDHRLHVRTSSNLVGAFESGSASGSWLNLRNTSDGGLIWRLISTGSANGEGAGNLLIGHGSTPGFQTLTAITVRSDGAVGIGTTAPERRLDVNGWMRAHAIEVTGGADIAEPFVVNADSAVEPGMVVSIDPANPGQMRLAGSAYDRAVAGVISGAGGVNTGMTLSQSGTAASGDIPVALTGRVYCYVDADAGGPVGPGDLLTTSPTVGHAMKVNDHARASGAIIGKAMTSLESGRGLVLVLVNLQ